MVLGRREVGDVVVDGDLDDALHRHDRRRADVVHRCRDRPRVPVPLRVLHTRTLESTGARQEEIDSETGEGRGSRAHGEVGGHAERAEGAAALGEAHAHAGERQRVERPAAVAGAADVLPDGAGVLQPLACPDGHPRRRHRVGHGRAVRARGASAACAVCVAVERALV